MAQMRKNSSYNLATNDIPFSPSLNSMLSLSSSKDHLNRGNLQTCNGRITHNQRIHDLISKSDSSIDIEHDVLCPGINHNSCTTVQKKMLSPGISDDSSIGMLPTVSQNQSDIPWTHILLQKNEKLEASNSVLDGEVNGCVCRSEKANQNYIVQIKSEPTTIVITRRGSTNSITAVGSCARFRAGGSDKENPRRGKKDKKTVPEEDSKAPFSIWERKDSDGRLSSTSGESIGARSTTDTDFKRSPRRNKENYFKRLSSRLSESARGRKAPRSSRASSPHHKRDMTDDDLKTRISKVFVPKDPRFFGPGRKSAYEGEGEENTNKSEGSNKREGRGKSFFAKGKPRQTSSRSRSSSKSRSPRPKHVHSKTGRRSHQDNASEPFYIKEALTPKISHQSIHQKPSFAEESYPKKAYAAGIQHQCIQTDLVCYPFEKQNKPGSVCCTCGMPTSEKIGTYTETTTEKHDHQPITHEVENKPRHKMVLSVRSDVRSTVAYDDFVELDESVTHDLRKPDIQHHNVAHRAQPPSLQTAGTPKRAPSFEKPMKEEPAGTLAPKSPSYQSTGIQCKGPISDHLPADQYAQTPYRDSATHLPHSPAATSLPRSYQGSGIISKQPSITDHTNDSKEGIPRHPLEPEEGIHVPRSPSYQPSHQPSGEIFDYSAAEQHGSDQDPGKVDHASGPDEAYLQSPWHEPENSNPRKEGAIHVYCSHCGCGLQTAPSDLLKEPGRQPPKDNNVSHVLWVLAKVTVFKDGTRNFEILESTSIPPGHYLLPGNEEFMIVLGNS